MPAQLSRRQGFTGAGYLTPTRANSGGMPQVEPADNRLAFALHFDTSAYVALPRRKELLLTLHKTCLAVSGAVCLLLGGCDGSNTPSALKDNNGSTLTT